MRRVRSGAETIDRVFTRSLTAPAAVRSTSLPGVPRDGQVAELELYGTRLALSTVARRDDAGVCGERAIRLITLGRSAVRLVATQVCGLDGQIYSGPSFAAGRLYYARSCNGGGGCSGARFGALRYRIADGSYASSPQARVLTGWAYDAAGHAYEARAECQATEDPERHAVQGRARQWAAILAGEAVGPPFVRGEPADAFVRAAGGRPRDTADP